MNRLTPEFEAELVRTYENEWEPGTESVDTFVNKHGVSKQQLYNVLKKYGIRPKTQRRAYQQPDLPPISSDELVDRLLEELVECRRTIRELQARLRVLEP